MAIGVAPNKQKDYRPLFSIMMREMGQRGEAGEELGRESERTRVVNEERKWQEKRRKAMEKLEKKKVRKMEEF